MESSSHKGRLGLYICASALCGAAAVFVNNKIHSPSLDILRKIEMHNQESLKIFTENFKTLLEQTQENSKNLSSLRATPNLDGLFVQQHLNDDPLYSLQKNIDDLKEKLGEDIKTQLSEASIQTNKALADTLDKISKSSQDANQSFVENIQSHLLEQSQHRNADILKLKDELTKHMNKSDQHLEKIESALATSDNVIQQASLQMIQISQISSKAITEHLLELKNGSNVQINQKLDQLSNHFNGNLTNIHQSLDSLKEQLGNVSRDLIFCSKQITEQASSSSKSEFNSKLQSMEEHIVEKQKTLISQYSLQLNDTAKLENENSLKITTAFSELLLQLQILQRSLQDIKIDISGEVKRNSQNALDISQNIRAASSELVQISKKSDNIPAQVASIILSGNKTLDLAKKYFQDAVQTSSDDKVEVVESLRSALIDLRSATQRANDVADTLKIVSSAATEGGSAHTTVKNAMEKLDLISNKFEEIIENSKLVDELNRKRIRS